MAYLNEKYQMFSLLQTSLWWYFIINQWKVKRKKRKKKKKKKKNEKEKKFTICSFRFGFECGPTQNTFWKKLNWQKRSPLYGYHKSHTVYDKNIKYRHTHTHTYIYNTTHSYTTY